MIAAFADYRDLGVVPCGAPSIAEAPAWVGQAFRACLDTERAVTEERRQEAEREAKRREAEAKKDAARRGRR